MRLLLDTQVFLWVVTDDPRLLPSSRKLLPGAREIYISAASIWEIAIKCRLGKLHADMDRIVAAIEESGFHPLAISPLHASMVEGLPDLHRDPFDRLLIAQALAEPLRLVTADAVLQPYSDLITLI